MLHVVPQRRNGDSDPHEAHRLTSQSFFQGARSPYVAEREQLRQSQDRKAGLNRKTARHLEVLIILIIRITQITPITPTSLTPLTAHPFSLPLGRVGVGPLTSNSFKS